MTEVFVGGIFAIALSRTFGVPPDVADLIGLPAIVLTFLVLEIGR